MLSGALLSDLNRTTIFRQNLPLCCHNWVISARSKLILLFTTNYPFGNSQQSFFLQIKPNTKLPLGGWNTSLLPPEISLAHHPTVPLVLCWGSSLSKIKLYGRQAVISEGRNEANPSLLETRWFSLSWSSKPSCTKLPAKEKFGPQKPLTALKKFST